MAREQSRQHIDSSGGRSGSADGRLNRRSYLKLAGAATAAAVAAATAAGASDGDYDVIEVDPGERRVIRVDSGETFENAVIDVSADGASAIITAMGTNWTIRNVGWRGVSADETFIGCADSGGNTSTIENVYMGDGAEPGHRNGLGIWLGRDHSGHLDINRVNIQMMGDNSFYLSAPHHYGDNGTVHLRNCYSRNSWVAHYRLGNGTLENCVAVNEATDVDERHGRGVWAWDPGPVEVRGCHFAMNGYHYSFRNGGNGEGASEISVTDTEWDTGFNGGYFDPHGPVNFEGGNGNDPEDFYPEGCPTSPEEAAGGEGATGGSREYDHTLRLEGEAEYYLEVDEELAPRSGFEQYLEYGEAYGEDWADWWVSTWTEWRFNGDVTRLDLEDVNDLTVYLDGEEIDPDDLGENSPSNEDEGDDESETQILRMEGVGDYAFETDGTVEPTDELAQFLTEGEAYGEDWADWYLTGSWTEWRVTGDFERFEVDAYDGTAPDLTFFLDGEEVTPEELGVTGLGDDSTTTIRMEGVGEYYFETDGTVEPNEDLARFLEQGDSYGENWADWYLTGSWTEWEVTGEFTTFEVSAHDGTEPDLTFYRDGEAVDPAELGVSGLDDPGERVLRLEGTADYAFETDGTVEPDPEIAQWVTEGEGYGDDWADWWLSDSWTQWHVSGRFTAFDLEAVDGDGPDVTVFLDGEEVDPAEL